MKTNAIEKLQNKIKKIQEKFSFEDKFDLTKCILRLPDELSAINKFHDSVPRRSEFKKKLNEFITDSQKMLDCLGSKPDLIKAAIDNFPDKISEICGNVKLENNHWQIDQFQTDLMIFHRICFLYQKCLPIDKGGRDKQFTMKDTILRLAVIFYQGTKNRPMCYWDHVGTEGCNEHEKYVGNFYEFLLDIKPILKELGMTLGTKSSIGNKAREALQDAKKYMSFDQNWPT